MESLVIVESGAKASKIKGYHAQLMASPKVLDEMVFATHFASADELGNDLTQIQLQQFLQTTKSFEHM